ncbi:hypothetical protein FRC07_008408 [Ceratobasidium sp. 392]|nr:hypothetical protein FRC07_008408 [Ceratobasidium sp. 392]
MPQAFEHIGFTELGKQLGILNSMQPAVDLFEKRSAIYSDRSCPPAIGEDSLMNWGNFVGLVGYNDLWRKYRRMMHIWLNKQAVTEFRPSQQYQARLLLQRLLLKSDRLNASKELDLELYMTISSTLLASIYGYKLQSLDDSFLLGMKEASISFVKAAVPSNFLVNIFPALVHVPEWFPGAGWKKTLREWGRQKDEVSDGIFNWTKAQIGAGNDEMSIVASLLKDVDKWGKDEAEANKDIQEVAVDLFGEVQAKAQQEIDTVVGTNRLPTMEDQVNLPYVGRLIQEVLRWQPIAPLSIPHVCAEENEYRGYRIPQGAIMAMSRNEQVYENPEAFNPDRYLDPDVPVIPGFGWGRRQCAGIYYANASLFINIVSILATFDISTRKDDNGNDVIPTTKGVQSALA